VSATGSDCRWRQRGLEGDDGYRDASDTGSTLPCHGRNVYVFVALRTRPTLFCWRCRHFECHFDLAERYNLPLFLHDRNTGGDFDRGCTRSRPSRRACAVAVHQRNLQLQPCMHAARAVAGIIRKHRDRFPAGVVHSFTGSKEELDSYLDMGLYIGINGCRCVALHSCQGISPLAGRVSMPPSCAAWRSNVRRCSLKTPENLDVVKRVPLDRLMLETGASLPAAETPRPCLDTALPPWPLCTATLHALPLTCPADAPWCDIRKTHASCEWISGWRVCLILLQWPERLIEPHHCLTARLLQTRTSRRTSRQ